MFVRPLSRGRGRRSARPGSGAGPRPPEDPLDGRDVPPAPVPRRDAARVQRGYDFTDRHAIRSEFDHFVDDPALGRVVDQPAGGVLGLPVADGPKTTLRPSVPIRFVFGSPLGNSPKSRRNASKTVPLLVPISRP